MADVWTAGATFTLLARAFDAAGMGGAIAETVALLEAHTAAQRRRTVPPVAVDDVHRRVHAGETSAKDAHKELQKRAASRREAQADAELAELELLEIRGKIPATLRGEVLAAWPAMREAFDAARAEFERAAAQVPDHAMGSAEVAQRSGAGVAFATANDAVTRMARLWSLYESLRRDGLLEQVEGSHPDDFRWEDPQALPMVGARTLGSVRWMHVSIERGAGPALVPAETVRERIAERERRRREERNERARRGAHGRSLDPDTAHEIIAGVAREIRAEEAAGGEAA